MILADEAIVTVYSDFTAILLLFGLITISTRFKSKINERRLFYIMCILIIFDSIGSLGSHAMHYQTAEWCYTVEILSKTFMEISELFVIYFWLLFVDYKLFESKDHLKRKFKGLFIVMVAFSILLLINPFTNIMFIIDRTDMWFVPTPLYHCMEIFEVTCVLLTFYVIYSYRNRKNKLHFFKVWPMMLPIAIGVIVSLITYYSAIPLGLAIGTLGLYFSMMETWKYEERDTGFYNKAYLDKLVDIAGTNGYDYRSAICIETKEDHLFEEALKKELPADKKIIHLKEGLFVFFSENAKMNFLNMVGQMLTESTKEYEDRHNNVKIDLKITNYVRKKDEEASDFIKRFV
ncbi:MAG: hypothetical protein K6B41_08765 [Butyrivibrio sp.]|nr:hypothetical protein [Butyrivibrio sp.]